VRCSGARVFLTPSHEKESFTAAIVVRSLWAALGEVWVVGLVVDRLVVGGLVVGSVVVAVDMGTCNLLDGLMEGPDAQTGGGAGLENPLAGEGFWAAGKPNQPRRRPWSRPRAGGLKGFAGPQ
jgi:hypothetical protein